MFIQYFFNKNIQFIYVTLLIQFLLFSIIFVYFVLKPNEYVVIFFSLSNLIIYIFFIWVIEKSLSIELLLFMYNQNQPLTIQEISSTNNLYDMSYFRIKQAISASFVNESNLKYSLTELGITFTKILSFFKKLYF
jgi:hypothetical protein